MFDKFKKRYHNMNAETRKEVVDWNKTWDRNCCQKCSTSFEALEKEAQMQAEMTGVSRILPVFVVDHIDGDSSHLDGYIGVDSQNNPIPNGSEIQAAKQIHHRFGNTRRLCWPCNRIAGVAKTKTVNTLMTTREKQDRINNEQKLIAELELQINERGHVCYKAFCKAGKSICDSSEITCSRYVDTDVRTPENPTGKFRIFPYECNGKFCNGSHLSWANVKPDVIIQEEIKILEREWEMRFGGVESEEELRKDIHKMYLWNSYETKEQYINKRIQRTW